MYYKKTLIALTIILGLLITATANAESKPWEQTTKYKICYGKLTEVHKKNGLHDRNRMQSIKIKETMCKAQAGY